MAEKKLSEELKHCLDAEHCENCAYHEPETTLICKGLLQAAYERIKGYEELEEQGKLIVLPCAVGDTVYTLNTLPSGKTVIGETKVDAFMCALGMLEERFGKTFFLTEEQAQRTHKSVYFSFPYNSFSGR